MRKTSWIILGLVLLCIFIMSYKIFVLKYHPSVVIPVRGYRVELMLKVTGHGAAIQLKSLLPQNNLRQTITDEKIESGIFTHSIEQEPENRFGIWRADDVFGEQRILYSFLTRTLRVDYKLPHYLGRDQTMEKENRKYLLATPLIQKDSSLIRLAAERLGLDTLNNLIEIVKRVYEFTAFQIKPADFKTETDAVVTLQLGEASCNGKSRLAVALLRQQNIPARVVGGIILKNGRKKTLHQWVEVLMGNTWVPFCPLNHHLFTLPANYLLIYQDDEVFFKRSANINFDYYFYIKARLLQREESMGELSGLGWNILNFYSKFKKANISLELLKIILMIPVGAFVTIIFRNYIGLQTFGTFLPVLIATAFRDTGLFWGLITFSTIIFAGALLRYFLEKLKLLHTPKLSIILIFVILMLLFFTVVGSEYSQKGLTHSALFPLAILAITIERFSLIMEEKGWNETITIFINSLIVVTFCYLAILSLFLQTIVMAFPELMLLIIAANIYMGRWTGIRLFEFYRFRHLIFEKRDHA